MSGTPSIIKAEQRGSHLWVLELRGEHDLSTSGEVDRAINDVYASGSALVVDLSGTGFIDSSIVAALVRAWQITESEAQHQLAVVAPPGGQPRTVLDICLPPGLVQLHDDQAAAVAALSGSS